MEAFPEDYVDHNLPLLLLSGLEQQNSADSITSDRTRTYLGEGGFRIRAEIPPVQGPVAEELHQILLSHDSSRSAWRSQTQDKSAPKFAFKIRSVGRMYTLPPRKAPPPAHAPRFSPANDNGASPPPLVLHSTLSPLTSSSPLYPEGLFSPLWITKHQTRLPSTFISFYSLTADGTQSSLLDNKIKSEIHNTRNIINSTHYKTRFVVVLLGNDPINQTDVEERLVNIRRAANLDAKSLFFLPHAVSSAEISDFAVTLLSGLYPASIEYYRDLSKHARRKRNRNTAPQPTVLPTEGKPTILSLASWNVRYEFKLGVFAEFRQEMEAACRNYETSYDGLFGAEVFEAIPSWNPRFNETRMFADVIAIRIIRCLLWSSQTALAVQWYLSHRNRIYDFINRRGKGSENYAWEAWQCVWSKVMSELVGRSEVLLPSSPGQPPASGTGIYVKPEKAVSDLDRVSPWEHLHHQGYWLNLAQRFIQSRRSRTEEIPEDERVQLGTGTGSPKDLKFDTYLVPDPHEEFAIDDNGGYPYTRDIIQNLEAAIVQFQDRGQMRMTQILRLKQASEFLRSSMWDKAVAVLHPLWTKSSWREGGWWLLLSHIGKALLKCAAELDDLSLIAEIVWHSSNPVLESMIAPIDVGSQDRNGSGAEESQIAGDISLDLSNLVTNFAFATAEGHVGEQLVAQLSLTLLSSEPLSSMNISEVKVVFEGGIKPVLLIADNGETDDEDNGSIELLDVELSESSPKSLIASKRSSMSALSSWTGVTNMRISPGGSRIWNLRVTPREAGQASVSSITVLVSGKDQKNTVTRTDFSSNDQFWWETRGGQPVPRSIGCYRDVANLTILPKPPKLDFDTPNAAKVYYTNEDLSIDLLVTNNEDAPVKGVLNTRLISPQKSGITISYSKDNTPVTSSSGPVGEIIQTLAAKDIGEMSVGTNATHTFVLSNSSDAIDHELEATFSYVLLNDPETPLTKTFVLDIAVIRPFEANIQFHPRLHDETWPNFFNPSHTASKNGAYGLKNQYLVAATLASFALESLHVLSIKLIATKIVGDAVCCSSNGRVRVPESENPSDVENQDTIEISPEETKQFLFDMTLQKSVLGDRQPVAADFILEIQWSRQKGGKANLSTLALPKFLAPVSEPRVLLRMSRSEGLDGFYNLVYTLENPSMHFLTFNVTMESGENFAFSGTKSRTVSLVPISRFELRYQILSYVRKEWIKVHLEVVDAYFGQTLKIQPAGDGVKVDKQGNVLVWIE